MTIPVVLVSGFLGAGKTTLINGLLREPGDRRIAAIVNDFGAIDIDAEILGQSVDGIVSLRNGCICCSLQGDLLRTLSTILRRDPAPDLILIETSGASDPTEIVRALLDPIVHAETPLDTVLTVVDAQHLSDRPGLFDDPLWRAQIAAADFCILAKTDAVPEPELARLRAGLERHKPAGRTFDAETGIVAALLLDAGQLRPARALGHPSRFIAAAERFESLSWTTTQPLRLAAFQATIGRLAPRLLRAKGFVVFEADPSRPMLFQLVGARATIAPAEPRPADPSRTRLVLIAEKGRLDTAEATTLLDRAKAPDDVRGDAG